ncbi:L-histidine N(alpha)-methyltransferase [Kaarinaea lacus]
MIQNTINGLSFYDFHPVQANLHDEVLRGLSQSARRIPPKFFYDERGSQLFDDICNTADYYPTRTEMGILEANINTISECIGSECILVEPGSGSSEKVRMLLDDVRPHAYVPMDISKDYLLSVAEQLALEYPWLDIYATCIDFTKSMTVPVNGSESRTVAFFPGSSIGNFEPHDAIGFLKKIAAMVKPHGGLLIGVDLKKEPHILNAAYNDSQGVTAQFNLNLLHRINRELGADFDVNKFDHHAFYNETDGRIEMHLVSKQTHEIHINGDTFRFEAGESIHTENSYKYSVDEFKNLAKQAGFDLVNVWTDSKQLFSVHYYQIL